MATVQYIRCEKCDGDGVISTRKCDGDGVISTRDNEWHLTASEKCMHCDGGWILPGPDINWEHLGNALFGAGAIGWALTHGRIGCPGDVSNGYDVLCHCDLVSAGLEECKCMEHLEGRDGFLPCDSCPCPCEVAHS